MFESLVAISLEAHAAKKLKSASDFNFAKGFHIASIMVHEFGRAANIYPIVFLEDPSSDGFRPVAMLGLEEGNNLMVKEDGTWAASYLPAIIRRYPFTLAKTDEKGEKYAVCFDESSSLVSEDEGQAFFTENGEPSEVLNNVKNFLGELKQMETVTETFCKKLSELNLFTPMNMRLRDDAAERNITGCYVINEERLRALSDKSFLELRELNYLPAIYAHLTSLAQVERLVQLQKGKDSISIDDQEPSSALVH